MRNWMYVHYGDIDNGFDYKVKLIDQIIINYLCHEHRLFIKDAIRRMYELKNPRLGWGEVFDGDERFYKYIKTKNFQAAVKTRYPKDTFFVCWMKSGRLTELTFTSRQNAIKKYESLKKGGLEVIVMWRTYNNRIRRNPLRHTSLYQTTFYEFCKAHKGEIAKSINKPGSKPPEEDDIEKRKRQCRNKRYVSKCSECCRYNSYGNKGCPIYTEIIDRLEKME